MKLGIASDEISQDFESAVSLGLEWGIEWFELKRLNGSRIPDVNDSDVKVVEEVLFASGAQLSSLAPGLFKVPLEPSAVDLELTRFERTVDLAHRLGVRRVIVFGFARDHSTSSGSAETEVIDLLGRSADIAASEGVELLLENEPAFWADCPDTARRIIDGVDSPALRLNWDPCNSLGCPCGAPYPVGFSLVRPHVGHVHVKDAQLGPDGQVTYVLLGTGDVDWVGQFAGLIADNYDGFCVLEPHFGNRITSSRSAVTEARKLIRNARKLLERTPRV